MAVSLLKQIFDKFETESAKKRRLFLEKVYYENVNTGHLSSSRAIGEALGYNYRTYELITDYWMDKGCLSLEEGVLINAGDFGSSKIMSLKITGKGIDEVERHWFERFVDRNKELITIVIAFVSLAISVIAIFKP